MTAIIAVLAAILFPVFAQAKAAAKRTVTLSNVKQVMLATRMYAADADDVYAMSHDGWNLPLDAERVAYLQLLFPYAKSAGIFWNGLDPLPAAMTTPTTPPVVKRSWGLWTFMTTIAAKELVLMRWADSQYVPRSESDFRDPAALMMYAPVRGWSPGIGNTDFVTAANVCVQDIDNPSFEMAQGARLHANGIFSGYADGHAGRKSLGIIHERRGMLLQDPDCVLGESGKTSMRSSGPTLTRSIRFRSRFNKVRSATVA